MVHGNEAVASNQMAVFQPHQQQQQQYAGKVNEETLASCSRTLNASFEKALELSHANISTDTSPTEQSSNMSLPSIRQITKDFEEKKRIFNHRPDTSVLSNGKPLSPILKQHDDNGESPPPTRSENPNGQNCITPPKIVRKDADRVVLEHVNEKDLFDTPEKQAFLSDAPFQYDTPPQKKLFADDEGGGGVAGYFSHWIPTSGVVHEVDTPKTCNTSNFSNSFTVSQIAFDPNKTNSCVDPEESFETFYSEDDSNRRRSYFDDTFDSIHVNDLPSSRRRSPRTLYRRVEKVFFSHVDTLVDKFVMACVQEKDVPVHNHHAGGAKSSMNHPSEKETKANGSHQPRVMAV